MDLTPERKKQIDAMSHYQLLETWRFSPTGNPWMQGETGEYWGKRMAELRDADPSAAVRNSKDIGWDRR